MTAPLRLALVGLGTWAQAGHLPVYRGARMASLVRIVGLCSRDQEKANRWASEIDGTAGFGDFTTMLRETQPDIVAVTTRDDKHTRYVVEALKMGCHVLVEKPMATSLEECNTIFRAASSANRRVVTLYHKRADPLWAEAAQQVRSGQYGKLQMGWSVIQNPLSVPSGEYFTSDMALHSDPNWFLGTHFYDLLRFITGLNPLAVSAHQYRGALSALGSDTADAFKADFIFSGGASISVMLSWNLPEYSPSLTKQAMTLHFQQGELDLDGTRRGFVQHAPDKYSYINPYFLRNTPAGMVGYGAKYLEEAIISLQDETTPLTVELAGHEDAWWASAMAVAVEGAVLEGGSVSVEQPSAALFGSDMTRGA